MKQWVIGIDEVGRGPLAGPVYVCAIAIPKTLYQKVVWKGLTDSKQMTVKNREAWYKEALVLEKEGSIKTALASRSALQIDQKGISVCIKECISYILSTLDLDPRTVAVLLDGGLKAPKEYIHQQTIIKGDEKEKIISLASVVAKVTRDAYMAKQHKKYPQYEWYANKGYGTKAHIIRIKREGKSPLHRSSFLSRILDK